MDLYEHQGKELFREAGIPVSDGRLATSPTEARAAADEAHASIMAFVATVTPDTNTEKEFRHFVFGSMNCRQWAVFARIHDADHAPSIGRIKASPGYPAS